jgi:hypothetical protein
LLREQAKRCVILQTKGVAMDSLWMFVGVMIALLVGGLVVYKKGT